MEPLPLTYLRTLNPYSYYTLPQYLRPLLDTLRRPLTPLWTTTDLLTASMDRYKTLRKPLLSCEPLRTLTAFTDHYKTPSNRHVLYSMADISKQIDEG